MRKLVLTLLLCTCCGKGFTQQVFDADDTRKFYGGLQLGANFSQVDGDGFSGYHKVGIAGGGLVYVRPNPMVSFSLGLGYAQKGSNEARIVETAIGPAVFRYRIHLQYAEVPLLIHLFFGGRLRYHAGISYNRLINSKEESESINPIFINQELYPFRKQDWCGIAGLKYRIYGPLFLLGQYQYTIGSIRSEPFIPPGFGAGGQRNNVMTLRLLYIIGSGQTRY